MSAALKAAGLSVLANDHLMWASNAARAVLLNDSVPSFSGLSIPARWLDTDKYDSALRFLNDLQPNNGFIAREYAPCGPKGRRYFTTENAGRIDAIRQQLSDWAEQLTEAEYSLLIADLLVSASVVSNTAGTYGSYLKRWKKSALSVLRLRRSFIVIGNPDARHEVRMEDANQLVKSLQSEAIYADPPFTKRQYAAYYHLLETIAAGDEPLLNGATGMRPWEHLSSPYCYRTHAALALEDLVASAPGRHFFLSYSDDGQIPHREIRQILGERGSVAVSEYQKQRYKSSDGGRAVVQVKERFYHLDREGNRGDFKCLQ